MQVRDDKGSSFCLKIEGYEFLTGGRSHYDENWLMISIEVVSPRGAWRARGPYMLRWEADELASWFEEISRETPHRADIEFVEPDLRFEFQNRAGEPVILRIQFEAEFLPPWGGDTRGRAQVEIQVSVEDLPNAAESLRQVLQTFPAR